MAARSTLLKKKKLWSVRSDLKCYFVKHVEKGGGEEMLSASKTFSLLILVWNVICRCVSCYSGVLLHLMWSETLILCLLAFPQPKQLRDADRVGKSQGLWLTVKADVIATSVPRKAAVWSAFCLQDFWDSRSRSGVDKTCPLRFWKASAQIVKLLLIRPTGNTSPLVQPNWYHC